ncbi:P-loop containing nucleoside triphosphate hydrolases superfamily protein [Striga hermonthica]|uniref:P-loop containing nucleoside triphosphate hydrolases superfamily protein n=1 Tax=Striga hermonthica TaxID=68872 RepID=A0A9N7N754_STRHE|nr:P-loop containing nucleoside triphosphate hydrolases superfamily protein [Striga hermonthica]
MITATISEFYQFIYCCCILTGKFLKHVKEVSRLRSLINGEAESHGADALSITFPGSPGSLKWEGHHGFSSPIVSEKKTPRLHKKEYEVALVGVLRREKDKDTALQALAAENQATLQLAKQREDEIQGLKMRLRFRESGIKRLEAVASGKISAEIHLLKEREEHLKEIEVLRAQVDRNQETTRFAMENLRLKEEIRRLKSFCEDGERERLNEQIIILETKLLEALDWKLMHESDPTNIQKERHDQSDNDFLISNQESASPWRTSTNEENEFLRMQVCPPRNLLNSLCYNKTNLFFPILLITQLLYANTKWHVNDLTNELEVERRLKETTSEESEKGLAILPSLVSIGQSDQSEIKTMVDAIAAASQREAQAHEMAIFLAKENDELQAKLKVLIEDNNKLIELYESAVSGNRIQEDSNICLNNVAEEKALEMKGDLERLNCQLTEMHEENDRLMSLYEKAMQERDELKKNIDFKQQKLVEVDGGERLRFDCASTCSDNERDREELDGTVPHVQDGQVNPDLEDETCLHEVHVGDDYSQSLIDFQMRTVDEDELKEINKWEEIRASTMDLSKEMDSIRKKIADAHEKLSCSAQTLTVFGSLERALVECEALAKSRLVSCSENLSRKKEELNSLELSRHEVTDALSKTKETKAELRKLSDSLKLKVEDEHRKLENERVLFAIDNVENRNWHSSAKATALLKSEEEKTKLQNEIKLNREKLGVLKKEAEVLTKNLGKIESERKALEVEIQKESVIVEEMNQKLENIIKEKEIILEVRENGKNEYETMIVDYYERLFEMELNEE